VTKAQDASRVTLVIGAAILSAISTVTTANKAPGPPYRSHVALLSRREAHKHHGNSKIARATAEDKSTSVVANATPMSKSSICPRNCYLARSAEKPGLVERAHRAQYLIPFLVSPFAELLGKTKGSIGRGHRWPNMFRMPAYDPVAIAVMGFGICLAAALAFGL
jgi:hypothetical protein